MYFHDVDTADEQQQQKQKRHNILSEHCHYTYAASPFLQSYRPWQTTVMFTRVLRSRLQLQRPERRKHTSTW